MELGSFLDKYNFSFFNGFFTGNFPTKFVLTGIIFKKNKGNLFYLDDALDYHNEFQACNTFQESVPRVIPHVPEKPNPKK